jgi:hypothetical protein
MIKISIFFNRVLCSFLLLLIAFSIRWFDRFNKMFTFISVIHIFANALFRFFVLFTLWASRECRFFRLRLWLTMILKNNYINMFNYFQSLFDSVFKFVNRFFKMNVSFNRIFLQDSIVAERWCLFSICN